MQFFTALSGFAALSSGVAALTITSPSASSYWVQFTNNTIAWSASSGVDPASVTVQIINPTNKGFNGPFAIAEYVKASKLSYDVTNVQLVAADGYQVQFINPTNNTEVLATSAPFSVKVTGTPEAQVTYAPGTHDSASNSSSTNNTSSASSTTSRADINGNSFKNNGSANANAKSSSVRAATVPSIAILAVGSLCALVA